MYLISGIIDIIMQLLLALVIFLLTLLGKIILSVCASIYTIVKPRRTEAEQIEVTPFQTMYPEYFEFEQNLGTMSRVSLETVDSSESENESNQQLCQGRTHTRKKRRLREKGKGSRNCKTKTKSTNTQIEANDASINTASSLINHKKNED